MKRKMDQSKVTVRIEFQEPILFLLTGGDINDLKWEISLIDQLKFF